MASLDRLAGLIFNTPLLIEPGKLAVIADLIGQRGGIDLAGMEPVASRFVGEPVTDRNGRSLVYTRQDGVAIISVVGSLVNRGAYVGAASGLVSYEGIAAQVTAALADPAVKAILLDLETPGGQAVGAFETAAIIRNASRQKPVTAVVNGMAASAGYALASGATRIVTTESGISGSIGVVMIHADHSRRLDTLGIKPTLIQAGARKTDGNPLQPLSDDARARLKAEVDALHGAFVATVAKGRPKLTPKAIRDTEAGVFVGGAAVSAGLADAVGTFDSALAELARRTTSRTIVTGPAGQKGRTSMSIDATTERERIAAILDSDAAKGREASAKHLAMNTGMAADDAIALLGTLPKQASPAGVPAAARAGGSPLGLVIEGVGAPGTAGKGPTLQSPEYYFAKRRADAAKAVAQ